MRVYRYKLNPTEPQAAAIDRTLETLRTLYNRALQERQTAYIVNQVTLKAYDQAKTLITDDRRHNADLFAVNVGVAKDCLLRLDKAFSNFFRRVKAGENPGYPKFKRRGEYRTFGYAMIGNGCKWLGTHVVLQNIGCVKLHFYRDLPEQATVRNLWISRRASGYYVCVLLGEPEEEIPASTLPSVGIDAGYGWAFMMTSEGECFAPEKHFHEAMEQLAELQRRRDENGVTQIIRFNLPPKVKRQVTYTHKGETITRMVYVRPDRRDGFAIVPLETPRSLKKRGWRYAELNRQIARLHEVIALKRKQWHIHVANALLDKYGVIIHEKLNIKDMAERPDTKVDLETGEYLKTGAEATVHQRRLLHDMAWGEFFLTLRNQAERRGAKIIEVDASDTTQTCSRCGKLSSREIKLRDTEFVCTACGLHLDRKINAARVILQRGTAQNP